MKVVTIEGDIGYDWWTDSGVTAKTVKEQLAGLLDGEEIQVNINSAGGSVYEGVVIFNLLRDHAKTHPVSVRINCMALSMASYIALAARTVDRNAVITVSDNSIVMIHNPWTYTWGDYRDLQREALYLEKLAAMYGSVHAAVSGQSEKDIRKAMDEETYYVGKEIVDAGFANNFDAIVLEESGVSIDARDNLIINAKFAVNKAMETGRTAGEKDGKAYRTDIEKAVALYQGNYRQGSACSHGEDRGAGSRTTEAAGTPPPVFNSNSTPGGGSMKPEELLAQDKACYEAVFALGEKAALEKERARVNAHLTLGKEAGSLETAAKYIEEGKSSMDEAVRAEYLALSMKNNRIAARNADDVGDINTSQGGEDIDAKALSHAFSLGVRGKTMEGKSWTA
ncbi:MAG: Clp protease ClpP [Treponema sp.]|nr:Clp protease ClpP [Treponema sp.]